MALVKCSKCGSEFYGVDCPSCGTKASAQAIHQPAKQASPITVFGGCFLLLAFAFAVFGGFYVWYDSHSSARPVPLAQQAPAPQPSVGASAPPPSQLAPEKPFARVSAHFLYREYDANEVSADETYKGKIVVVTGEIQNIGKDVMDTPYIIVGGQGFLDGVQCIFPKSDNSPLANLHKGESVTVQGQVAGKMGNVLVRECQLE